MLQLVDVSEMSLDSYIPVVGEAVVDELRRLAEPLRGARVAQINATAYGGGVSELLRTMVPLERDLGLATDWRVITGAEPFFTITKEFHNALQGAKYAVTPEVRETYLSQNLMNARFLGDTPYDYIIVHDPQPAALRELHGRGSARWVWRCHIDTAQPDPDTWDFLRPFVAVYDAAIFTMQQFAPRDLSGPTTVIIAPAIDPFSPKNAPLPPEMCRRALAWLGLNVDKPIITQISRFDRWKDPLGVIAAYRLVRKHVPDLQLALFGAMALDDPEGWEVYRQVMKEKGGDSLIHVHTNLTGVGNFEINALQRTSSVVVQKSTREGFGLVISEALWKNTPVVATDTGGISLQAPPGIGGFLISTVDEAADKILYLLNNPAEATALAAQGAHHVKEHFLITRLLADELRLLRALAAA